MPPLAPPAGPAPAPAPTLRPAGPIVSPTAAASRRELVAWLSLDLDQPLATLRDIATALSSEAATDDLHRYHALLHREAERLTDLVEALCELTRPPTDRSTEALSP